MGALSQVARIDRFTEDDGPARGARRLRMITGGGLEIDVHPDRALDLGHATVRGVPVAWISPTGIGSPHLAEHGGTEWLRTFGGGLLATCGLDTFGPPSTDDGVEYPMHGRVGTTPASVSEIRVADGELRIAGEVRQAKVFQENLVLRRTLTAPLGGTEITITDTVTNEGLSPAGHLVLYHANFGWPLLDERAALEIPSRRVTPRDAAAAAGVARWAEIEPPQPGFAEQVFLHDFSAGEGRAVIDNPAVDVRCELLFDAKTLPALHQWKMSGVGHYVMGLEPANVGHIQGRARARADRVLPVLEVGESVTYSLTFRFGPSQRRGR
ncbi:aldose 1-epimerase family protein [Microbacterium sp. NPDC003461]